MNFLLMHSNIVTIFIQAFLIAILWTVAACAWYDVRNKKKKYKK